jgi:hypothetical protein
MARRWVISCCAFLGQVVMRDDTSYVVVYRNRDAESTMVADFHFLGTCDSIEVVFQVDCFDSRTQCV